jgi:hypothetical protein
LSEKRNNGPSKRETEKQKNETAKFFALNNFLFNFLWWIFSQRHVHSFEFSVNSTYLESQYFPIFRSKNPYTKKGSGKNSFL